MIKQGPKDNLIGVEVKVDSEDEVAILAVGEETHGFQAKVQEGILEEEWDNAQEGGAIHQLIHLHAMCARCVAI